MADRSAPALSGRTSTPGHRSGHQCRTRARGFSRRWPACRRRRPCCCRSACRAATTTARSAAPASASCSRSTCMRRSRSPMRCCRPCSPQHGVIVGFGSIAGARGRSRNIVYAAAKRGLQTYFESLRHGHLPSALRVQFHRLGFLRSNLTFGMKLPLAGCRTRGGRAHGRGQPGAGSFDALPAALVGPGRAARAQPAVVRLPPHARLSAAAAPRRCRRPTRGCSPGPPLVRRAVARRAGSST